MAKKETTAVAERENTLPISADLAELLGQDSGAGFEGVTTKDVAIPYYGVLQALSPQVKRGTQKIEGAEEGDIINTVTNEIIKGDAGIIVIPCTFVKRWVEWVPREDGGGFVGQHPNDEILKKCTINDKGRPVLSNGNQIVETAYHYILRVFHDEKFERALISMTSSQLKKSRRWLAQQMNLQLHVRDRIINPPPYSHTYHLRTVQEEKDSHTWFGWSIANPQIVTNFELYQIAKKFAADVQQGLVEIAPPPSDDATSVSTGASHEVF